MSSLNPSFSRWPMIALFMGGGPQVKTCFMKREKEKKDSLATLHIVRNSIFSSHWTYHVCAAWRPKVLCYHFRSHIPLAACPTCWRLVQNVKYTDAVGMRTLHRGKNKIEKGVRMFLSIFPPLFFPLLLPALHQAPAWVGYHPQWCCRKSNRSWSCLVGFLRLLS